MRLFRTHVTSAAFLLAALAAPVRVASPQGAQRADTGNALPITPVRTLSFTTDEGTWMSLDVSPDGKTIVFDLLGDLYTIPIGGGDATRLTSGMGWDYMPRWSPDGSTIAFASDRGGNEDIWLIDRSGGHVRRLTHEVDARLSSPTWTRDGQYIVARRTEPYPGPNDYGAASIRSGCTRSRAGRAYRSFQRRSTRRRRRTAVRHSRPTTARCTSPRMPAEASRPRGRSGSFKSYHSTVAPVGNAR